MLPAFFLIGERVGEQVNIDAIVLVSFGVSIDEVREKSIDCLYKLVSDEYPQVQTELAYTSHTIRKKLADRGNFYHSPQSILDKLACEGVKRVLVQPMHLIAGSEFHKIAFQVMLHQESFEQIVLGKPLFYGPEDYKEVLSILKEEYKPLYDEVLVLMGHGSEHPMNAAYSALAYECLRSFPNIIIATVEGYPSFEDALAQIEGYEKDFGKLSKVKLAPLLFVAGDHAKNDMASKEDEDSWFSVLSNKGYTVEAFEKGLGEIEEVLNVYLKRLKESANLFK